MNPHFETPQLLVRLGVALAVGMLVGIEEADRRHESAEAEYAREIRNLGAIGLLGGLTLQFDTLLLALLIALWTVVMTALHHLYESHSSINPLNLIVTILTFFLGTLAGAGQLKLAACGTLALMLALRMLLRKVA